MIFALQVHFAGHGKAYIIMKYYLAPWRDLPLIISAPTGTSATETATKTTTASETSYEDNFAVPTEDAVAFAKKIQAAVANEDLEALADLTHYPVYVSIADDSVIESKEDLIALGADKIFTDEMKDSISNAALSDLSPSMAGFTLYSTGDAPNMIFSVQNGKLGISGMNY